MARSTAVATPDPAAAALPAILGSYAIAEMDPAELKEVILENVGAGGIGQFDLDRIKVPAGGGTVWSIPTLEGDQPAKEITGVIVHFADQRAYWKEAFGGGNSPPDCSSTDAVHGVGDPGVLCADCPFSKFGTAVKQDGSEGRGQACRLVRVLYMLLPHAILPTVVPVPPSSYKRVKQYFLRLASQGIAYHGVQTKLKLAQARSGDGITYSEIVPEFAGRLTPDDRTKVAPLKDMLKVQTAQTLDAESFRNEPPF